MTRHAPDRAFPHGTSLHGFMLTCTEAFYHIFNDNNPRTFTVPICSYLHLLTFNLSLLLLQYNKARNRLAVIHFIIGFRLHFRYNIVNPELFMTTQKSY